MEQKRSDPLARSVTVAVSEGEGVGAGLPLAIRRWAALALHRLGKEKPRPRNEAKAGEARAALTDLADNLDAAAIAMRDLPEDAKWLMIEALVSSDEDAPEAEETPTESLSRIVKAANSRERLSEMAAAARRAAEQIEAGALNVEQVAAGPRIGTLHVAPSTVGGASTWETTGREACGRYELVSEA